MKDLMKKLAQEWICGLEGDFMLDITLLIKDGTSFTKEKNVFHFFTDEAERPKWSTALDNYYTKNSRHLQMKRMYKIHCENVKSDSQMAKYFQYITERGGITVDLASGPSGYFAPVFDFMENESIFIATDASKAIVNAHQKANVDKRFCIFDVDLDKGLPFKDESIDAFCGNLLDNVDNYRGLLAELARSLKPEGRFAVIEQFYEMGSQTYDYLRERNAVYYSLENFIAVCKEFGLTCKGSSIRKEIVGKISEGDLLPIGENDKCLEMILYFEKVV